MIHPLEYKKLVDVTAEFLSLAKKHCFCQELIPIIKQKLYEEAPVKGKGKIIARKAEK